MSKEVLTSLIRMEDENKAIVELKNNSELIDFIKESSKESLKLLFLLLKKKQKYKLSQEIISINPELTIREPDDFGWYLKSLDLKGKSLDFDDISKQFICCDLNPSYTILCWQLHSEVFARLISRNRLDDLKRLAEIGFDFPSFELSSEASIITLVSSCTECSLKEKKEIVLFFLSLGCEINSNFAFKKTVVEELVSNDEYWYPSLLVELGHKMSDYAIDAIKGMSVSKVSANSVLYEQVVSSLGEQTLSYRNNQGFGIVTELVNRGLYALPIKLIKDKRCFDLINSDFENLRHAVVESENQDLKELLTLKREEAISLDAKQLLQWAEKNYPQFFNETPVQDIENLGFYDILSTFGLAIDEEQGLSPESYLNDLISMCFSLADEEVTNIQVHTDDNWSSAQISLNLEGKPEEFTIPNIGMSDWVSDSLWESIHSFSHRALRSRIHTIISRECRYVFYISTSEFEKLQGIVERESQR